MCAKTRASFVIINLRPGKGLVLLKLTLVQERSIVIV
jgi:hypothetical protein